MKTKKEMQTFTFCWSIDGATVIKAESLAEAYEKFDANNLYGGFCAVMRYAKEASGLETEQLELSRVSNDAFPDTNLLAEVEKMEAAVRLIVASRNGKLRPRPQLVGDVLKRAQATPDKGTA